MDYELAKKLKDAGFSQNKSARIPEYEGYVGYGLGFVYEDGVYSPTLSELIEACGDSFHSITLNLTPSQPDYRWICIGNPITNSYHTGSTPEEAVANLWLTLNIK